MDPLSEIAPDVAPDGSFWLTVNGRTLHPLLRPGDEGRFHPCEETGLRVGDIVLTRRASVWMVRLVVRLRPLQTAFLRGQASTEYGMVPARLTARRRGGRVRQFGAALRIAALLYRNLFGTRLYARAREVRVLRQARALPQTIRTLRLFRGSRASRLGRIEIRRLTPGDEVELLRFADGWLPHLSQLCRTQLPERWQQEGRAFGAFTESGAIIGFVYLDEYTQEGVDLPGVWVRALKVVTGAQRLGIGRRLLEALCADAADRGVQHIYADIHETNTASLRLFGTHGFRAADIAVTARLNELFLDPDHPRRMVAVERRMAD